MINVSIITLGCSKNDIDSAQMKSMLDNKKYLYTNDVTNADAIIVNTCGFIDDAKEESIDTILELLELKKTHKLKKLLLAGCLAQRYPDELLNSIPEADGIIGPGYILSINEALEKMFEGEKFTLTDKIEVPYIENVYKQNPGPSEYVKISEGCNNRCSYCIIPKLKGNNRSRKIESIVDEVKYLVSKGTKEIILIGQNTTDYGIDLYNRFSLVDLLKNLSTIDGLVWIRILYAYPDNFSDELIEEIGSNNKIVPYLDIPIQHVSDNILKNMNRRTCKDDIISLIKKLRKAIPKLIIRTTFIVGFPGETNNDFSDLLNFIEEYPLDKVGCFIYSKEDGTPAATLPNQISEDVKISRRNLLMETQSQISSTLLQNIVGEILSVLITEKANDELYIGRSFLDAPDVDGVTYIKTNKELQVGEFYEIRVIDSLEYDLVGELYEHSK